MVDIVDRLREPLVGNELRVMQSWDSIRNLLLVERNKGSYPRDVFESLLGEFDEEREEAATEIATLRQQIADAHEAMSQAIGSLKALGAENGFASEALRRALSAPQGREG